MLPKLVFYFLLRSPNTTTEKGELVDAVTFKFLH